MHETVFDDLSYLEIVGGQMDSLDNLTTVGVSIDELRISSLPNLDTLILDPRPNSSASLISLSGNDNLSVTLGGPSTVNFTISSLILKHGIRSVEHHPSAEHIRIKQFTSNGGNNITELSLP